MVTKNFCDWCDRELHTIGNLKNFITHHGKKDYDICDSCRYSFEDLIDRKKRKELT